MKQLLYLLVLLMTTSCANYIKSIHAQIDREEGRPVARAQAANAGPVMRGYPQPTPYQRRVDKRPITNPITLGEPSTQNTRNYYPDVQRQYQNDPNYRYTAKDLLDNDESGSLWNGKHGDNFLFVTNNIKKEGDFVIIEVKKPLKESISEELKRIYPTRQTRPIKKSSDNKEDEKTAEVAKEAESPDQVYDKISAKVVEKINNDYLLVKGNKEVMYQNMKRYIQFQAVVPSKNINDNDTVSSDILLEPRITVLRY